MSIRTNVAAKKFLLLSMLTLGLSACLQTRENAKEVEEKQVLQTQVKTLQRGNADTANRFEEIEAEGRRQNGRIEALEARLLQLQNRLDRTDQEKALKDKEQLTKFDLVKDDMGRLDQTTQELTARVAAIEEGQKHSSAAPVKGADAARTAFKNADELFSKKQWKEALLEYEKYRKAAPRGKSFAAATYKIGVCFQELGLADEARAFYDEVIAKFPGTPEAEKSTSRLRKLKKK